MILDINELHYLYEILNEYIVQKKLKNNTVNLGM